MTKDVWDIILPGYSSFSPTNFLQVLSYLLASLVFHRKHLADTLHIHHPLRQTRLWTSEWLERLVPFVHTGCGKKEKTKLVASGVPSHILLANEIVGLRAEMQCMREELMHELDQLPELVKQEMLNNFAIGGAIPITHEQVANNAGEYCCCNANCYC